MKKKDFLFKDRIIKGITDDGFFRVSVVKTTQVVKTASKRHELSLLGKVLLGRALTGTMLLASSLKGEERITLRLEGNGPAGLIHAEANSVGEIRGFMQNPQATLDVNKAGHIGDGIGLGVLTVSKTLYNEADAISGSVEIVKGTVSEDIAYYLMQSEQIQSAIHLDVALDDDGEIASAGGILIQALPGAPENKIDVIQNNLKLMPPVSDLFLKGEYIDDILKDIAAPYHIKELSRNPVHFFCRCTKDRFITALSMLGPNDLQELSDTGQELVCHYCNGKYMISKEEIRALLNEKRIQMN
ncbi:MAG: Hsp33 family molecular chaperone HslO [Balneolales bacterium]|nr:Hsp33 family molecular chaperone HslO [Balneolales bacterium]